MTLVEEINKSLDILERSSSDGDQLAYESLKLQNIVKGESLDQAKLAYKYKFALEQDLIEAAGKKILSAMGEAFFLGNKKALKASPGFRGLDVEAQEYLVLEVDNVSMALRDTTVSNSFGMRMNAMRGFKEVVQ